MTNSPNPYQPPAAVDEDDGWWPAVKRLLSGRTPLFKRDRAIIFQGIAYFIQAEFPEVLFAASPSVDHSQERMDLIADEAIRLLPEFLADHRRLARIVQGRRMVVRIVSDYETVQGEFFPEREVSAELVAEAGGNVGGSD